MNDNEFMADQFPASEDEQDLSFTDGYVIPLQFLGVSDTDLDQLSLDERMKYALANMNNKDLEGEYIVRHSLNPMSDFGTS